MARLHFASGRTAREGLLSEPLLEEARSHAASDGGVAHDVNSREDVRRVLDQIRSHNEHISLMDFHSHGSAGRIGIGVTTIDERSWGEFNSYADLFSPGARVMFHGCSVANAPVGELFMARCAWALLRVNGGSAIGWASEGLAVHPALGWAGLGSTPIHVGGEVEAVIRAGGNVSLRGAQHLRLTHLRNYLESLRGAWRQATRMHLPADESARLEMVRRLLDLAEGNLQGSPGYAAMRNAAEQLSDAGSRLPLHALTRPY